MWRRDINAAFNKMNTHRVESNEAFKRFSLKLNLTVCLNVVLLLTLSKIFISGG
jgi:hypothetical protein